MKSYYFAYGSNLCPNQMKARCPDHEVVCTVLLANYELCFPRFSRGDRQCGVASVVEKINSIVFGVLYLVTENDITYLDQFENIPSSYQKTSITVHSICRTKQYEAITYLANHQVGEFYPSEEYLNLILNGLKQRSDVPEHYIEHVSKIKKMSSV